MAERDPWQGVKVPWDEGPAPAVQPGTQGRPPPTIPDHTLIRRIGQGSYGEVWLARNVLGLYRAVKIVHRGAFDDQRPFEREFAGIQRFEPVSRTHESQLNVLHVGRGQDCFYYVMELADDMGRGAAIDEAAYTPRTLRSELLLRGRLPVDECLRLGLALATALGHLHRHGLVHRDIKPSNIVFVNGIPKLADIGLVAHAEATMSFVGTEGYLPPEGPGTVRADLFSLGKVLYEISTGHDRQQFPELPTNVVELPDRAALAEYNEVLLRACAPDIKHRYQTAAEMHADLALLQSGKSVARMRVVERRLRFVARAGAAVTALAAVVAAGWLWQAKQTRIVSGLAAENLNLARRAEHSAELARKSELAAREKLYAADIDLAYRALQTDNIRLARSLLLNHVPQTGHPDLRGFEWRYLWEQCRSEELISIQGHTNTCYVFALAPDGQHVVVCSRNKLTKVLDLQRQQEVAVLPCTNEVLSASFSPDGNLFATGSAKEVQVWNARAFALQCRLSDAAAPVAFSPDGKFLLTGKPPLTEHLQSPEKAEQTLRIWNVSNWTLVRDRNFPASGHASGIGLYLQPAFGNDPSWLAVLAGDTIRIMSFPGLQELSILHDKVDINPWVRPFLALSPDNRTLAFPSKKRHGIQLWDIDTNQELRVLAGHVDIVIDGAFSPDSAMLATCSPDQTVKLWDVKNGELLNTFRGHGDEVFDLAFSADGKRLVSLGAYDAVVKVWAPNARSKRETILKQQGRDFGAIPVGFDPAGRLVAFTWPGMRPAVLDPATLETTPTGSPECQEGLLYEFDLGSVSANGRYQGVQLPVQNVLEVWDRSSGKRVCSVPSLSSRISFDSQGQLVATVITNSAGYCSAVWQLPAGTLKWTLTNEGTWYRVFAKDGDTLLTYAKQYFHLWRIDGEHLTPYLAIPKQGMLTDVVISPDGTMLAATSTGDITIRALPSGNLIGVLKGHTRKGPRLAFSPDGRTLASACDDLTLRIWHISTQREVLQFQAPGEDRGDYNLEFSPDGRTLLVSRFDEEGRVTRLYFAPSLAEIAVAEGRDYRSEAKNDPNTWFAVAKALARRESSQEAMDAFNEVLTLTSSREDLNWLRADALRQMEALGHPGFPNKPGEAQRKPRHDALLDPAMPPGAARSSGVR